jgi:hypothetical protein
MFRNRTIFAAATLALVNMACSPAERSESGEIETAGSVDAFSMQIGDCFNDQSSLSGEVSDVPGVPCDQPHDNEVYSIFDLTMADWPGDEQANEVADAGCLKRFEAAIGATYEESVLMITTLIPSKGSWAQINDREVVCAAYHMELEKLTNSVLNSGM